MKTTCIQHPINEPFILIHRWQIEFCQGNYCAAALLSFYEYWHNMKLCFKNYPDKFFLSNKIPYKLCEETDLLQPHTSHELISNILHLYSRVKIIAANNLLEKLGVIRVEIGRDKNNPLNRTRYIQFIPDTCNAWLNEHYPKINSYNFINK